MRSSLSRTPTLASMLLAVLGVGGVGVASAAPFILVPNRLGTVSVIDAATNSLATRVPIAASSLLGIAVAPDGASAYVGGPSGTVWVIDTAAGVVTDAIPVGSAPRGFAFTRDGARAYVVDQNADVVWVIDTATRAVVDSLDLPATDASSGWCSGAPERSSCHTSIAIAPDDSRLYVVYQAGVSGGSALSIVDPSANRVVASIPVGEYSSDVALSPDGALAYVVNQWTNQDCSPAACGSISVVDTSSGTLIDTIPTGQSASQFIAIRRDGLLAYVSNAASNTVSVIDLVTRQVIGAPIPVGADPAGLVFTPDERFVYVAHRLGDCGGFPDCGYLSVIDTRRVRRRPFAGSELLAATIPVGQQAGVLAIAPTFTVVPPPECADRIDNDFAGNSRPGADWPDDPGCESPADGSEKSPLLVCDDGIDNDADGLVDYPTDPGCLAPASDLEDPACSDGIDDDGDGLADFPADAGCESSADVTERSPAAVCDDGIDNDSDGLVDFPTDPGCESATANLENPACEDGIDNDFDGLTDYPADLDCQSLTIGLEESDVDSDGVAPSGDNCVTVPNPSQLDANQDGYGDACDADYDDDGIVGGPDLLLLGRAFGATTGSQNYAPALDADGDGAIGAPESLLFRSSFGKRPGPSGLSCAGTVPCPYFYSCGLGFELAFVLPPLMWLYRRRRGF